MKNKFKEKRKRVSAKKLQKKYNFDIEVGLVITYKNGELHGTEPHLRNILTELQEKIGFEVCSITFERGKIFGVSFDKNRPIKNS